ncbi:MAG: alpha-L-fucosidase [Kiritimatiellae bacterium]|jgi:alpha-L-fucosidase|nr:alpha-L-fucosidase [Kiritimatiellia bacterium]
MKYDKDLRDNRMEWFKNDRFGMFIHWGLYAIPARGEWVRFTQKGNILYAHIMEQVLGHICMPDLRDVLSRGWKVADGAEVILTEFWNAEVASFDEPTDIFFNFAQPVSGTYKLPDEIDTVVAFELQK